MAQTVLVTGGAGFIGSHLCDLLCARGFNVRVLDNLSFGRRGWLPPEVEFIQGDIIDLSTCLRACQGVDGVIHAAAMSRAAPSLEAIDSCTRQNITGTQNILLAARDAGVRRFIYSGSSTYYGNQPGAHREEMPPQFLNFYALSKYVGEEYCQLFDRVFNLPVVVLRYFNVYGPRQPQTGAYALVLGIFLNRWRNRQTLEIHGSGEQRRDFIHVRDVAACILAAYQSEIHGMALNVGSGSNISVKELADLISPDQVVVPRRAGDADVTLADISRTCAALAWRPQISFQAGLDELKDRTSHGLE